MKSIIVRIDTTLGNEIIDLDKYTDLLDDGDHLTILTEGSGLVYTESGDLIAGSDYVANGKSYAAPGVYMHGYTDPSRYPKEIVPPDNRNPEKRVLDWIRENEERKG